VPLPDAACTDSLNVLDALLGQTGASGRDHLVQQDNGVSGNFGLRVGDWKLVRMKNKGRTNAVVTLKTRPPEPNHALYFLPDDPSETQDVKAQHPDRLKALIAQLDELLTAKQTR
jgi:hypothetical protein